MHATTDYWQSVSAHTLRRDEERRAKLQARVDACREAMLNATDRHERMRRYDDWRAARHVLETA